MLGKFLQMVLGFLDLNEASVILELRNEGNALSDGIDSIIVFINSYVVLSVVRSSFGISIGNVFFGFGDKIVVVMELGLEGFFEWVEDVIKLTCGWCDVTGGGINSILNRGIKGVVVTGFKTPLLHFKVSLEVEIVEKLCKGSLEIIKGSTEFELELDELSGYSTPSSLLEGFKLIIDLHTTFHGEGRQAKKGNDESGFHFVCLI